MDDKTFQYMETRVEKAKMLQERICLLEDAIDKISSGTEIAISIESSDMVRRFEGMRGGSTPTGRASVLKQLREPLLVIYKQELELVKEEYAKL